MDARPRSGENPNRRGFVRATANGHALQYADGTPFFLLGDTWLAASTWRLPWRGEPAGRRTTCPGPGISFEEAVAYRKRQGFNSISFIAAFPNWDADHHGATFANADGVYLRNAWEKFGHWAPDAAVTHRRRRHDHGQGHGRRAGQPAVRGARRTRDGLADFDRLNPAYFRSLDRKMRHLADQGFVPFLETVRRDSCPSWKAYFDFDRSYARYVQYLIARYGAFNLDLQRHPPRLDPEGVQPHRRRVQRRAHLTTGRPTVRCRSASRTRRSSTARRTSASATASARRG